LVRRSDQFRQDKDLAFKFMLTEESEKQKEKQECLNFYTNQMLDECRRVGKINGDALVEHFMNHCQYQCDDIQKEFDTWSEVVAYLGSLEWDKPLYDSDDENKPKKKKKKDKKDKKDKKEKKEKKE